MNIQENELKQYKEIIESLNFECEIMRKEIKSLKKKNSILSSKLEKMQKNICEFKKEQKFEDNKTLTRQQLYIQSLRSYLHPLSFNMLTPRSEMNEFDQLLCESSMQKDEQDYDIETGLSKKSESMQNILQFCDQKYSDYELEDEDEDEDEYDIENYEYKFSFKKPPRNSRLSFIL